MPAPTPAPVLPDQSCGAKWSKPWFVLARRLRRVEELRDDEMNERQVLAALLWLAGPRDSAASPDAYAFSELRRLGLARSLGGGAFELTPNGIARLVALKQESMAHR